MNFGKGVGAASFLLGVGASPSILGEGATSFLLGMGAVSSGARLHYCSAWEQSLLRPGFVLLFGLGVA